MDTSERAGSDANRAGRSSEGYGNARRRPRIGLILLLVLLHLGALYGLARLFAPDMVAGVEREVLSTFSIPTAPPEPAPPPDATPDDGAAGEPGREAIPRPETAPELEVVIRPDRPLPRASAEGRDTTSGAREEGSGTGAAGEGLGTGSGNAGSGQGGGGAVTRPSVRSGRIDAARDFPIPEGGRATRFGTRIVVAFTVGIDGRASNCSVIRPGPDPRANAALCQLVIERIRFNPARDAAGNPVPARYGWEQTFDPA